MVQSAKHNCFEFFENKGVKRNNALVRSRINKLAKDFQDFNYSFLFFLGTENLVRHFVENEPFTNFSCFRLLLLCVCVVVVSSAADSSLIGDAMRVC